MLFFRRVLWAFLVIIATTTVRADTVSIAAATDLVYCLDELNKTFRETHPDTELKVATGSSGNFFAQIKTGAPFDIFLSADVSYPQALIDAGLADKSSLSVYAVGHIVLWTTSDQLDLTRGLAALRGSTIKKVAIANPDHAPYGKAAKAALERLKLWDELKDKLVFGDNIAQTAQFIQTGNADAGVVALSLVLAPNLAKVGHWVAIPPDLYPPLKQAVVLTKKGMSNPAASTYLEFLRSPAARAIFDKFGFSLPREAP
ncbi:molybdate ABC transporter substrate-binding protein [soil metagenome]